MQIQCKISDSIVDVFVLLFCASVRCRMPGEIKKERARERERGGWKKEKGRKRERELVHQRHQQVNRPQSLKTKMSVLDEECIYYMGLFVYELFKSFQTYGTMQCVTE